MKTITHAITKKELQDITKETYQEIIVAFAKKIDSLLLDKKMDRIITKIELTLEEFKDIMILIKLHHNWIKELEEQVAALCETKSS